MPTAEEMKGSPVAEDLDLSRIRPIQENLKPLARAFGVSEPMLASLEHTNPLIGIIEALPAGTKITIEIGGQPR